MTNYYPRKIQIINASSQVSDADAYSFAQAANVFLQTIFGPAWDIYAGAEFCSIASPPSQGSVPIDPSKYGVYLVDGTGPSGVGGEHFHYSGQSYAEVWLGSVGTAWPETAAHEMEEMLINPLNGLTAGPDGTYICALEVCDAVEHNPIYVTGPDGRSWPMEDFCTPEWFVSNGVAPFDYLGKTSAPFTPQAGGRMPS